MCTLEVFQVEYDGGIATMYMTGSLGMVYVVIVGANRGFTRCLNYRIGMPETDAELQAVANAMATRMGLPSASCTWTHSIVCGSPDARESTLTLDTWVVPAARL